MSDNRYRRQHPEDELTPEEEAHLRGEAPEKEEEDTVGHTGLFSPEEQTYKKRYGDLRRHTQKQLDELKAENERLRASAPANQMPKTKEEVQEWIEMYPDLAGILKTIMREEIQSSAPKTDAETEKTVAELKARIAKQDALQVLLKIHPDFHEIRNDQKFHDWVKTKSVNIQNSLYRDLDPQAAAESVSLYKAETGSQTKAPKSQDNRSAATSVGQSQSPGPRGDTTVWSESRINKMSLREYEKHEEEINEAIRKGQFKYDVSGGAR